MSDYSRFEGTVAAIATPPGLGGVGIIRVSGPAALALARRLVPALPEEPRSHHLYLRDVVHPATAEHLDRALVAVMPGPHSFTGEDVLELHCHGGPVHLRQVLDAVLLAGARPAEAGEFTRRAFLNGRLDLVQAEALGDLIEARSEAACRLARRHLEGRLSRELTALREALAEAVTLLEAGLDFSLEEHVFSVDRDDLRARVDARTTECERLLASYDRGRRLRDGLRCVIAGRPNAGKSTLLNELLAEERAIVAPTPGTTRDYLDADFVLDGHLFTLIDTAGLRETGEPIELEGVRRTRRLAASADLILYVADARLPWGQDEAAEVAALEPPGLLLWNKLDLADAVAVPPPPPPHWFGAATLSLRDGSGLDALLDALRSAAARLAGDPGGASATLSRARHRDALERGRDHLKTARRAVDEALDDELVALDLRLALDAIGEIVGAVTPDDILERIFSRFCIGK